MFRSHDSSCARRISKPPADWFRAAGGRLAVFTKAPEDVYTVSQYAISRDAVDILERQLGLKSSWGSRSIDVVRRFDPFGWDEAPRPCSNITPVA